MENNLVTENQCKTILEKYLKSPDFLITNIRITSLADIVSGMMAEYYKLTITANFKNETITKSFFCKKLVVFHKIQEIMSKAQGAYEKEEFVYNYLLEECNKIPNFQLDFPPECYLTIKDELIVLENLIDFNYQIPKLTNDLSHSKLALEAIAEFHACSIIYEEVQSKLRGFNFSLYEDNSKIFADSLYRLDENYLGRHWFLNCLNSIKRLIDLLPPMPLTKDELKEKLFINADKVYEIITPSKRFKNVCCHGDLSNVNVLYKYNNNIPLKCKLVDYQALRYNPPAHDVMNFIYLNSDAKFRDRYLYELLDFYYKSLEKQLLRCGLYLEKFISKQEFSESCMYVLPQVVLQTAFYATMRPVIKYFPDIPKDQVLYKRYVYEDRSSECLKVYGMCETFREIINEIVLGLCNL